VLSFLKIAGSACSVCYAGVLELLHPKPWLLLALCHLLWVLLKALFLGGCLWVLATLSGVGPLGNDWRMLSFCFIQLGFAKLVEPGCWTFCLLR
ncbi:hypothetical protein H0E87_014458, partial [Populus deltoides]